MTLRVGTRSHATSVGEEDRASVHSGHSALQADHQFSEQAQDLERLRSLEKEVDRLRRRLQARPLPPPLTLVGAHGSALDGSGFHRGPRLLTPEHSKPLAVVIPMVGLGDSFAEAGFRLPRPLVNVVGRPVILWMLDNLHFQPKDLIILAVTATFEKQYGLSKIISREFPNLNTQVVILPFDTRGWVETIFSVVRRMSMRDLRLPLVTLDCSTIFHGVDVLQKVRDLPEGTGASVYFDVGKSTVTSQSGLAVSRFSYIKLDSEGFITSTMEKQVISSSANVGAYIFKSAREFRAAAEQLLEGPATTLYASALIQAMILDRHRFLGLPIDEQNFEIVSSPAGLQRFITRLSTGEVRTERRMRFCFELDGTLVTEPQVAGDFGSCEPVPNAIALIRELHAAGHVIIITTSRGMELGRGKDVAMAEVGRATFSTLSQFDIPYHEIHFGRPYADVYIDSRTLNSQGDIERDLGWKVTLEGASVTDGSGPIDGAVDARAFNLVRAKGKDNVIKSSSPQVLRGECHWYRNIPISVQDLFPECLEITEDDTSTAQSSITMSKVAGITFSHLATTRLLLNGSVRKLVRSLHKIHTQEPAPSSSVAAEAKVTTSEMCANYAKKVKSRYEKHSSLYKRLGDETGLDTKRMLQAVVGFLENFEAQESCLHTWYLHGDPVFSNVLRTANDEIVFIDMRGELGDKLTTQGDLHYDLSKVFQSLCGYDFMLLDQILDDTSSEIFDGLRATFWEEVRTLYPDVSPRDVRLHTASHFFTIVPLHEVRSRMQRYLRTCNSMLSVEGLV